VRIARAATAEWAAMTGTYRGQVLYRVAEMLDARTRAFAELTGDEPRCTPVDRSSVWGWPTSSRRCWPANPVAGPYFNFTVPEPTGVVGVLAPDEPPLLDSSRLAPVLVGAQRRVCRVGIAAARGDRARRGARNVGRSSGSSSP